MFYPHRLREQLDRDNVDIHKVAEWLDVEPGLIASWAKWGSESSQPRNSPVAPTEDQCRELEKALALPLGHLTDPSVVTVDQPIEMDALQAVDAVMGDMGARHHEAGGGAPGCYTLTTDEPETAISTIRARTKLTVGRDLELTIRWT